MPNEGTDLIDVAASSDKGDDLIGVAASSNKGDDLIDVVAVLCLNTTTHLAHPTYGQRSFFIRRRPSHER